MRGNSAPYPTEGNGGRRAPYGYGFDSAGFRLPHRFGTGSPQLRQTVALMWTGLPQRGQTRRPASILIAAGGTSNLEAGEEATASSASCEVVLPTPLGA